MDQEMRLHAHGADGKRGEQYGHWARIRTWLTCLAAVAMAIFGGVGLEVCLREEVWERHIWVPSALILLALLILTTTAVGAVKRRL